MPTDLSPRTPATPGELARCRQVPPVLVGDLTPPANPLTQSRPNQVVPPQRPPCRHQLDTRTLLTTPLYARRSPDLHPRRSGHDCGRNVGLPGTDGLVECSSHVLRDPS